MEDWYPYLIIPWGIFKEMISEKKLDGNYVAIRSGSYTT